MRANRTLLTMSSAAAAAFALLLPPVLFPSTGSTQGSRPQETVTVAADEPIPNLPGKRLVSHIVDYPPGGRPLLLEPIGEHREREESEACEQQ